MWDPEQEGVTREEEGPLVVPESRAPRFVSLQQAPIQPPLPPLPSPPLCAGPAPVWRRAQLVSAVLHQSSEVQNLFTLLSMIEAALLVSLSLHYIWDFSLILHSLTTVCP